MGFKLTILSVLLLSIYLIFGGFLFWWIEHEHEKTVQDQVNTFYQIYNYSDYIPWNQFQQMINLAVQYPEAFSSMLNATTSTSTEEWQWDVIGSLFFSLVVVSTIGYGNQKPVTMGGRLAVVLYAFFGIPICLHTLNQVAKEGKAFTLWLSKFAPAFIKKRGFVVPLLLVFFMFLIAFIMPAALFYVNEKWSFNECLYYSFITLSTIGFGDLVAGDKQARAYKILVMLWMFIGLAYVATIISFVQEMVRKYSENVAQKKLSDISIINLAEPNNQNKNNNTKKPKKPITRIKTPKIGVK